MQSEVTTRDNFLEALYEALSEGSLSELYLPHSDTYYVREALLARTGKLFSLRAVELAIKKHNIAYPCDTEAYVPHG